MYKPRFRPKTTAAPARQVLFHVLRKLGLKSIITRLEMDAAWQQLVGEAMAANTVTYSFTNGVLTVKCSPGAWQNELTFLKESLVTKLNEHFGKQVIKELRIISGFIPQPLPPPPKRLADSNNTLLAKQLTNDLEDPQLRAAFERAIQKGLNTF
jgi:hypothetical protein